MIATLALMATPAHASGGDRLGTLAGDGVWVALYPTGAVATFDRWNTGVIASTSAWTSVSVAAAAMNGQLGNSLYQNIWTVQLQAAWEAANGKCLWVWVSVAGDVEAGGYNC
jgi:hypothetical protein